MGGAIKNAHRSISLILSFVNAPGMATINGLEAWLLSQGFEANIESVGLEDVAMTAELRDGLRRWIAADGPPPAQVMESLNRAGRMTPLRLVVAEGGSTRFLSTGLSSVDRSMGEVLAAVHDAITAGVWSRLRVCRDPSCGWVFFDQSRNRSGVWCDMAVCGNRAKARNYRARRRASRS